MQFTSPPVPPAAPALEALPAESATSWWDIVAALGPLAVLLAGALTFFVGWKTLEQRRKADQRSEWWTRAQWAIEASLSDDPRRQETGLGVLDLLAQSDLAGAEEAAIISIAWARPLTAIVDSNGDMSQNETITSAPGMEEADDDNSSTAAGTRR
ncbi:MULTISPECIES: hypothetical protein [unclassified Arthrobacter]|uniref:hypothetical protein n=1 Tax=unclassified Arthrobacter TaxID=235627 RepID=UPI001E2DB74C|nr:MULTISPECIES: hypothetical protein [unclassified Arthrobacter]MCC9145345.1 hypothetical protein [Arthrobacter sp. zg-Y919]MDK1276573.1 hypothetical protein [Arthrobacter sp. zg.Y919]WIB01838.1 hypothetical protein QNO10_07475 [Arthrobacter sp. zg-Y919]